MVFLQLADSSLLPDHSQVFAELASVEHVVISSLVSPPSRSNLVALIVGIRLLWPDLHLGYQSLHRLHLPADLSAHLLLQVLNRMQLQLA